MHCRTVDASMITEEGRPHGPSTTVLDDLLNDGQLARLFSKDVRHCALQLWVLQLKSETLIENRVVYGRLVPYSFSNDNWSATEDDHFRSYGKIQAQIVRLNLYIQSAHCAELLRCLCAGLTISAVSDRLELKLASPLRTRFGATALAVDELVYRPVAYLLNRDAFEEASPSSPHGAAGALSASIVRTDKGALFRLDQRYDVALTKAVIEHLNADTGLAFGGVDAARFGDLELLVFPALDDQERPLLSIGWRDAPLTLVARFNSMQVPQFSGFQFRLMIATDKQIAYSGLAVADQGADGVFECKFEVSEQLRARTDSTELEIFGFHSDHSGQGRLCCRWRVGYIREFHFQGHVIGGGASPIKFDWLEKATRPAASARVKAALTMKRGGPDFGSRVGGREADPWVPANRDLTALFSRLHPPKSDGRFFQRWSQGDGEGRLQFVEWFKALLAKYKEHQLVIFDPYFEVAGLALLIVSGAAKADYIVFTTLTKPAKQERCSPEDSEWSGSGRLDNLMLGCEQNSRLLKRFKLRIYGLKDGRLHDRYILIMAPDGLPLAGFNLSNSFQKAAENYPLLVTPIPPDVLLEVEQYKSGLVREAEMVQPLGEVEAAPMRLLFDSTASPAAPRRYEPLRFLVQPQAGDVLSRWTGELSLRGMSGDLLKDRLETLGLIRANSLALVGAPGLRKILDEQNGDFGDFTGTWDVLGDVVAHTSTDEPGFPGLGAEVGFLDYLNDYLKRSFNRRLRDVDGELAMIDGRAFVKSLDKFLHSAQQPQHLFHPTKYTALSWSEYYAIKFLWRYAPGSLLAIAEREMASASTEPQVSDAVHLSLLSQIVSEISLSVQFDITEAQRSRLIQSGNGLLRWLGLNAIERQLDQPDGIAVVLNSIAAFSAAERIDALGWMVHRAARPPAPASERFNGLVQALHDVLPETIAADELKRVIDAMRGHMGQLPWAEPWLFQDVIYPVVKDSRASADDACEIWVQELTTLLEPGSNSQPQLFDRAREGQTTNITAFLLAQSSPKQRRKSVKAVSAILRRQQRIIQQPLASTSDWTRWDSALVVAMWILSWTRWAQHYLGDEMIDPDLQGLSGSADELAMIRSMDEWRSMGPVVKGELIAFLDQAEELLANPPAS